MTFISNVSDTNITPRPVPDLLISADFHRPIRSSETLDIHSTRPEGFGVLIPPSRVLETLAVSLTNLLYD